MPDTGDERILLDFKDHVATLTLVRPEKLNALDMNMVLALERAAALIEAERDIRVAVLTGTGETSFCAGGDINDLETVLTGANLDPNRVILHICGADVVRPMVVPGVRVEPLVAYRADMVTRLPWVVRVMIRLGCVTGVLFFSARTGQAFVNTMKKMNLDRACAGIGALCLSDSVVESVSDLPWRGLYTAQRPDRTAMLDLLDHLRP